MNDYIWAPCNDYLCYCADSHCRISWGPGCIAEYMKCQPTQICGDWEAQPPAVTEYKFGQCPNYKVVEMPTP
jgi:hypothetical protein